ncbi:unnamed protein product [Acanthosepion pharaonis]|uniref:MTOR-associated protein MEAK7 n=1 Tax=Acanthosepion pharaonis TaxID=158019 RepID=A0A812ER64_ACAPH|nr:unnamed protein product [Sepia pharaonis]
MINSVIPHRLQMSTWSPLFCSNVDGFSFQRLIFFVENKGPTVIIIKDSEKHVFGGFASHRWNASANFIGDEECFLFTLSPEFNIYLPTGYNKNFMYFNYGVHTMPSGMAQYHQSTLDRDPAAKAVLSLLARGPHSEGLRQGDSFAELPDHPQIQF